MVEEQIEGAEVEVRGDVDEADIRDTDIVFDCPHCGKNLVIDYRGAGLQINCSECGESVLVPIPDGMELRDLDLYTLDFFLGHTQPPQIAAIIA